MLYIRVRACLAILTVVAVVTLVGVAPVAQTPTPAPDAAFFDDTVLHDINLTINSKDWETLKIQYLENDYYPTDFRWRTETVRNIGIRSRGVGSRSGIKPGLRLDFNRYTTDQQFRGLKSVVLRNNTQDWSNIRERVSMLFFRRMGIKTEREAHARLFVNGAYAGLYTIVESVDKAMLKKNFGENDGHLYSYKFDNSAPTPFNFGYLGPNPGLYTPSPFKDENSATDPQGEVLERLFWTINVASDAVWRTAIEEFLDVKQFMRYLAIENFLAEEDGITGDYGPNNFFIYRFENKNLYTFIPWDKSNTFWANDYSIFQNIQDGIESHRNRLVLRALGDPELREVYLSALLECADSALAVPVPKTTATGTPQAGWLETEVAREYGQIGDAARADTSKPFSNADFEQGILNMTSFAQQRSDNVRQQVAADRARRSPR